jgi:hypothetical protein
MTLDCLITVKGTGTKARYGKPAKDTTKTIREFLVDNSVYYTAVLQHLRGCTKCDPMECLQIYLDRRLTPKFKNETSPGLADLAFKYDRLLKKRGLSVPREMLAEFVWRSGSSQVLLNHGGFLKPMEKAKAIQLAIQNHGGPSSLSYVFSKNPDYRTIYSIVSHTTNPPTSDQELLEMMEIAEVHLS